MRVLEGVDWGGGRLWALKRLSESENEKSDIIIRWLTESDSRY